MAREEDEGNGGEVVQYDPREHQRSRAFQIWSYSDTGHDLTVEEQLFCRSYIVDRNEVAAMRRLGYGDELSNASCRRRAQIMLNNPEVQGCIEVLAKRMMENLQIEAENVNRTMAAIAFGDPRDIMEWDANGVQLLHSKFWTREQALALKSVKMGKEGIQIEFADRQRALEFLGKQLGVSNDESEIARAAAEGAARGAMDKILEITERMRPEPKSETDGD